jgi:hypothetical protein
MRLVVQIQVMPDADSDRKLRTTVERFNAACNWIAGECFTRQEANVYNVRKFAYHEVRERFRLSSQMAQLAIKAVCDAYKRVPRAPDAALRLKTSRASAYGSRLELAVDEAKAGTLRNCG